MDRVRNGEVSRRAGIERELTSRADQWVLRWFRHVEREWMSTVWPERCTWPKSVGASTRETKVTLDGWWEGGLRQQRNGVGGCATMRERSERVESPGTYVTEWVSRGHFCFSLCSFGPLSRTLVVITWRGLGYRYMMRLGKIVKMTQLLNIKAQMSSIYAKGCMLMIMCVLTGLTWLPLLGGFISYFITN